MFTGGKKEVEIMCFWLILKYTDPCYAYYWAWNCSGVPEGWDTAVHNFGFHNFVFIFKKFY